MPCEMGGGELIVVALAIICATVVCLLGIAAWYNTNHND